MNDPCRGRTQPSVLPTWAFVALLLLIAVLQVVAIHQQSLGGDGAYHLLAGHQALRYGQNLLNLEHPPLPKLVMALPLLFFAEPLSPPVSVDRALIASEGLFAQPAVVLPATTLARYMVLTVFVVPFFYAVWRLGRRWGGAEAAKILVVLLGLSFSVLPNLTILQTDAPAALGFVLVLLAGARYVEKETISAALALGAALGLAMAVKYSGVLLAPTVFLAWLLVGLRGRSWRKLPAAVGRLAAVAVAAYLTVDLSYALANWDYERSAGRQTISTYCEQRGTLVVADRLQQHCDLLLAIEERQPRLAQWTVGLLGIRIQNQLGIYPSYYFGKVNYQGHWWYFPVLFLIKTPLAILLALGVALVVALRRRWPRDFALRFALPLSVVLIYVAAAVTSNYNLGVRHLLPVMALLYLPAARLLAQRTKLALGVLAVLALEALVIAPTWMCQTNTWMLGAANPTRFSLGAGNLDYRQNFIVLARSVRKRGIAQLHVIYPPLDAPAVTAYLPDAKMVQPDDPLVPGWYAVNVRVEQYLPAIPRSEVPEGLVQLGRQWQPVWQAVRQGEDHGYVACTFHLYHLE